VDGSQYIESGEAARILGVSQPRVTQLANAGSLPVAMRVGARRLRLYDRAVIERAAAERAGKRAAVA
jgi:phage terminase Nu1 subunit (DNA packaging protein)